MHCIFEEFLFIRAGIPACLLHLAAELVQAVRIILLRVIGKELASLRGCKSLDFRIDFARKLARLSEYHIPDIVANHAPALLALFHLDDIHQSKVLDILGERCHKSRITHFRPYISDFVKELYEQLVGCECRLSVLCLPFVELGKVVLEVSHKRTHHTTRQTRLDKQGVVDAVEVRTVVAKKIVKHCLDLRAHFHISFHIDFLDLESGILEHFLYGNHIGVTGSPGKRRHTYVNIIATRLTYFEYGSHTESRTGVRMILDYDIRPVCLDSGNDLAERHRPSYAGHILEAYLVGSSFDELLGEIYIIIDGMYRRMGYAKRSLGNHSGFLGIAY